MSRAVAGAIFLARNGKNKKEIANFLQGELGELPKFNIQFLQRNYIFTSKAINSVPQALYCFLKSTSFENCARLTVSIGGDTDTTAAIACSIAGAYYGIPNQILFEAKKFIPNEYLEILEKR